MVRIIAYGAKMPVAQLIGILCGESPTARAFAASDRLEVN
jgi:hypothetical protein